LILLLSLLLAFTWICVIGAAVTAARSKKIRGQFTSPETQQLLNRFDAVEFQLSKLTDEVSKMSNDNTTLDQAVADLDTAITNKLAEDQALDTEAQAGLNESADVAKVEALVDKLNAETAAEQTELASVSTPAPVSTTATEEPAPDASTQAPADSTTADATTTTQS